MPYATLRFRKGTPQVNPFTVSSIATEPNNPDIQTADTIQRMRQIVKESISSPIVISATHQALGLDQHPVNAIYQFIKQNVTFSEDHEVVKRLFGQSQVTPFGEDLLITPQALISQIKQGDCDDFSMLAASMLAVAGIQSKFVTIAADNSLPDVFSHVYVIANDGRGWIPFDASHGKYLGWEYQNATRKQYWNI